MGKVILLSGGAGYIGSHVCRALRQAGYDVVVIDSLVTGNRWAAEWATAFRQGDIADVPFVEAVCERFSPVAALHFAAFIEVGESVQNPAKYFTNNRDKAQVFLKTLSGCGVNQVVFSSSAAVYGAVDDERSLREDQPLLPVNPYGQSKLDVEQYLRALPGMRSVSLRYFNVAGAAPDGRLGEAHFPESHLFPRLILPLIDMPPDVLDILGLSGGFSIYGNDYPTRDGTAVRDYIHVMDLADAHVRALDYLIKGGATDVFNLGSGSGYSVKEIVEAVRRVLNRPDFSPGNMPRRAGDPPCLVANSDKASAVLGWRPMRGLDAMIADAAAWHKSDVYTDTIRAKGTR